MSSDQNETFSTNLRKGLVVVTKGRIPYSLLLPLPFSLKLCESLLTKRTVSQVQTVRAKTPDSHNHLHLLHCQSLERASFYTLTPRSLKRTPQAHNNWIYPLHQFCKTITLQSSLMERANKVTGMWKLMHPVRWMWQQSRCFSNSGWRGTRTLTEKVSPTTLETTSKSSRLPTSAHTTPR